MDNVIYRDDRLYVHDNSGKTADRELPLTSIAVWLGAGHDHDTLYAAIDHDHDGVYVELPAEVTEIAAPTGGETEDAEARTAINAILTLLGTLGVRVAPEA